MKRFFLIVGLSIVGCLMYANAGWWSNHQIKHIGEYVETYAVTVATDSTNLLWTQSPFITRAELSNNSGFILYIGTNTATLTTTGFEVYSGSSTTYVLDGQFTGSLYGRLAAAAAGDKTVRVILYKKNQ